MPQQKCVVCRIKLKVHQRRPVNKYIRKYLRRNFLIESTDTDYICGKCSRPAYRQNSTHDVIQQPIVCESDTPSDSILGSPSNIKLNIQAVTKSHAYCFLCKKSGPGLVVVPQHVRTEIFIHHNIVITGQSRCCPCHLDHDMRHFIPEAFSNFKSIDHTFFNRTAIKEFLDKVRQLAITSTMKRMSFENLEIYSDTDMNNLTGLTREQFQDLHCILKDQLRGTPVRTTATTTGIFLLKLKSGLSNSLLSTLFGISKSSIRRAVQTVRKLMMKHFVPQNLGFQHISRKDIIDNHTRTLAQSLLADSKDQAILVLDGTYIYINKSSNFQFQRRSYSIHKGRSLVKPMVIVSTTGYFVSVLGPYFSDTKNNDASILNQILHQNVEQIKNWIKPNDIFVVDRGFRDSLTLLADLGIQAEMPAFIKKGEKQLSTGDANTSRLVTKVTIFNSISEKKALK